MLLCAPIRRYQAVALALAGLLAVSPAAIAQTAGQKPAAPATPAAKPAAPKPGAATAKPPAEAPPGKGTSDRYTATAVGLGSVTGETITVDLIRWSTDAERDAAIATFVKGEKELLPALQAAPNIGYIWRSGSGFGSFVRYATKWKAADGEHVVLITDSDLSAWQQPTGMAAAKPAAAGAAAAVKYPFTVIEIVAPAVGLSTGKMSLASKVINDPAAKTIRLEDFKGAALALRNVRHLKGGS